jgi:hypothetical protein
MNNSGLFSPADYRVYRWTEEYSAQRYVALMNTFEYIQILPAKQKNELLTKVRDYIYEHGDCVVIPQCVELYLMRKK